MREGGRKKGNVGGRRERASVHLFFPEMTATAAAGPGLIKMQGLPFGCRCLPLLSRHISWELSGKWRSWLLNQHSFWMPTYQVAA